MSNMKGLTLTLSVVVVAIALVVTVLVVITVFNQQIAQFLGIIGPYADDKAMENLCKDRCATYCSTHLDESGTDWSALQITLQGETSQCDDVMRKIMGNDIGTCEC